MSLFQSAAEAHKKNVSIHSRNQEILPQQQYHRKFQFYAKLVELHRSDMVFPLRLGHCSAEASKKISEQLTLRKENLDQENQDQENQDQPLLMQQFLFYPARRYWSAVFLD